MLETVDIDDEITDDFIELQRIEAGVIINEIRTTEYNELEIVKELPKLTR